MTLKSASSLKITSLPQKDTILMTGDELFNLDDIGSGELIKGVFIQMAPPGYWHGFIEVNFCSILQMFVNQHKLGYVIGGEAGIYTNRDPDTVRGVDCAFISHARMAQVQSNTYLDVAPELIVEILSPNDRWNDLTDKLTEYFAINVLMIWVVDPKQKQIHVYRSLTEVEILTAADELLGDDVLPNFSVPIAKLFKVS